MRISDWSSDVGPSDLEIVGRKKIEIEAPSRRHLPLLISNLHGVRDRHQFRHHDAGLSLRGRLRHSRAKIGRARQCKTDEQDHSDNSDDRSEEHASELQSLMRSSYAVYCLKTKTDS